MRIKILLLGDNPASLVADAQLLRERGMIVFSAFNLENIVELIAEIKPNLLFFDAHRSNPRITEAYNNLANGMYFSGIPVIFTLSEDDVYLVTRKRTEAKNKRTLIADNMIDAIKLALQPTKNTPKKPQRILKPGLGSTVRQNKPSNPGPQLRIPFYS
jgi:response regulator RpfG family c-di-GMP phosphodiesterase